MNPKLTDIALTSFTGPGAVNQGATANFGVTVQNTGTGRMPVEVAAAAGDRWMKAGRDSTSAAGGVRVSRPNPEYRESRGEVTLGPGESGTVTIHCAFAPKQVVVDPDVRILQLRRKQAVATL